MPGRSANSAAAREGEALPDDPRTPEEWVIDWQDEMLIGANRFAVMPLPEGMQDGAPFEDWAEWKPLPGGATAEEMEALEAEIGLRFPPVFRAWFMARFILNMEFREARMPTVRPGAPLGDLIRYIDANPEAVEQGIVPFAFDGNDAGLIALDFRTNPEEPTVLLVEFDYPNNPALWPQRAESFRAFLEMIRATSRDWWARQRSAGAATPSAE